MKWLTIQEKAEIKLSLFFRQLLDGMLLGDGTLKQECTYPSFWIEQKDEEFVKHLWEEFKKHNLVNSPYKRRIKIEKRLNKDGFPYKDSITYRFSSCSFPYFQKLMKKWYTLSGEIDKRGRAKKTKIVPEDLKLTPVTLAYWIAGDGSFVKGTIIIHTNSFTKKEVLWLVAKLSEHLNLKATIRRFRRKGSVKEEYLVVILKSELEKVRKLIGKILFRTYLYRIGL